MRYRLLLIVAFITIATMLTSCNTVKGVGKDVENLGEKIQKTAD